jgi:hypothetical protein
MSRTATLLTLVLCLVPLASATLITAGGAGCNGVKPCPSGPYLLNFGGEVPDWTFDYSVPNKEVKDIAQLNGVVVNLEMFDRYQGNPVDLAGARGETFSVYLVVEGGYSLLLGSVGPNINGTTGNDRYVFNASVPGSELPGFLAALRDNKGDFGIEVVATSGNFWLGDRKGTPGVEDDPGRYVTLDVTLPEPASFGMTGIGLLLLCGAVRKKIAR